MNQELSIVVSLFLALVFVPSALGKMVHLTEFGDAVQSYELLPSPLDRTFSALLPIFELAIGFAYLLGFGTREFIS